MSDEKRQPINELHLNLLGKLFLASTAAWLVGRATNVKIRGTQAEINTVAQALLASKRFQEELARPGATVESVMQKLGVKNMTTHQFQNTFGIPFPG
jgi:hypothetical protein